MNHGGDLDQEIITAVMNRDEGAINCRVSNDSLITIYLPTSGEHSS